MCSDMKVNKKFKVLEEYSTPVLELIGAVLDGTLCAGSTDTNEPFEENTDWGGTINWE